MGTVLGEDGEALIGKPIEIEEAEVMDAICRRYGCLPPAVYAAGPALVGMLKLVMLGAEAQRLALAAD